MLEYDYRMIEPGDELYLTGLVRYSRPVCRVTAVKYELVDGKLFWYFKYDKRAALVTKTFENELVQIGPEKLFFVGNEYFDDQYYLAWMSLLCEHYIMTERVALGLVKIENYLSAVNVRNYFSNTVVTLDNVKDSVQEVYVQGNYLRSCLDYTDKTAYTGEYNDVWDIIGSLKVVEKTMRCIVDVTTNSALIDDLLFIKELYGQYLESADLVGNKHLQSSTGESGNSSRSV